MVRYKPFLRWFLLNSIVVTGSVFAYEFGLFYELIIKDKTKLSILIILLYITMSLLCGWRTWNIGYIINVSGLSMNKKGEIINDTLTDDGWFVSEICLTLGMIGTVIGFIMMLYGGFENVTVENIQEIKKLLNKLGNGLSTALYTTLVGLISSVLLKIQYFNLDNAIHNPRK